MLNNRVDKIDIEESLIESCRNGRTRSATFLDENKKIDMETKKEFERRQKEKNPGTEIEQLERDRNIIREGICIAERCIEEGNTELDEVMKAKVINRERLISCQTKISMDAKRKTIIRGIKRIGQQNRKEEERLKHKLLRFL